jgi:hypothetical protein
MFGYWKRRALKADVLLEIQSRRAQKAEAERDRLDSAIGWWHEWHDTLRRVLGMMYCDTGVTLAGAKQLIKAHRAQAAIAAIDHAHLRYERRGMEERADKAEAERRRLRDETCGCVVGKAGRLKSSCYYHSRITGERDLLKLRLREQADQAEMEAATAATRDAELARVVAQRERLLELLEEYYEACVDISHEPVEECIPVQEEAP